MKKMLSFLISAAMVGSLAACGGASSSAPASSAPASSAADSSAAASSAASSEAALSGKVSTNGSTSMEKVIASLSEAFMAKYPDVTVTYDPTGSGAGITAAAEGTADIGLASRDLKDSETGLDATVVAIDGIAVIVNNANPVSDLSLEQIAALYKGEITNWKDVGGADAAPVIVGREAGSGTRDGFESITKVGEDAKYDQELTSTGAVIAAVAANKNAIGYASLSSVGSDTKTLTVGGVACTEATVLDGSYAIQRNFNMITKQGAELSPAAKAFIEFALSPETAGIIANAGAIQAGSAPAATPASASAEPLSGKVSTNGSTSMEKVIASLSEAFMAKYPDVTVTYDPTGSGAGITAAAEGTADIGLASRDLKDSETGLDATVVAIDGIAVIVNNANPVSDLSLEQIAALYKGEITNWKDVGGADAAPVIVGREAGSGTRDGFESITKVGEDAKYDQELTSTGAVIAAVAANKNAIGYASLSSVGSDTKTLTVGGVACTEATVLDGSYAIQRNFNMITKQGAELSPAAKAFIEFALSDAATEIIANAGAVQAK